MMVSKDEQTSLEFACGFYSVGINLEEVDGKNLIQKQEKEKLDIVAAFTKHELHMLCLSELGEQCVGLGSKLQGQSVNVWLNRLLRDTVVSPVIVYNASHHATIVRETRDMEIIDYKFVEDFISEQRERRFQYFRVRIVGDNEPVSVIHCNAPSSEKCESTLPLRRSYIRAFHEWWREDRSVWGGNFNTVLVPLVLLMAQVNPRFRNKDEDGQNDGSNAARPGKLQVLFSNRCDHNTGGVALIYGIPPMQEKSKVGATHKGVSKLHDLVVARNKGKASTSSAVQPGLDERGSSTAEAEP